MQTATSAAIVSGTRLEQPKHFLPILSHVIREEGFTGLFQGASIRVATHMPGTAISFWGYDLGKKLVRLYRQSSSKGSSHSKETMTELAAAGAFSGIPVTLFETPCERIKCLLQTQARSPIKLYQGPMDCGVQLFQQAGLAGLYRGLGITAARNIPGFSVWFGTYEFLKKEIDHNNVFGTNASARWLNIILSGGMAGSASWTVMIPFDAVKSVIQTSPHDMSISEAYRQVTAKSKWALFRGIGPIVLIAFPANAMCFLGMEMAWKALWVLE
jgi:solute carrier family 25 carnitine/acylcarnitine transporter 20/29